METAERELTFLLAAPERRLLRWLALRLPAWWTPNLLTGLGVLGAIGVGVGYALTPLHPAWLWFVCAMLVVNWFGDSLDGTLARVRHIERPKYGYYIDHMVDAFNTAVVGVGLGLSAYVSLPVALLLVIAYLALSINIYLESSVFGIFEFAYGIFGPTEARLVLIIANGVLWGAHTVLETPRGTLRSIATWVVAGAAAAMFAMLVIRFAINLTRLSRVEPRHRRTEPPADAD